MATPSLSLEFPPVRKSNERGSSHVDCMYSGGCLCVCSCRETEGPVLITSVELRGFFQYTIITIAKCIASMYVLHKPYTNAIITNAIHAKMLERNYFATQLGGWATVYPAFSMVESLYNCCTVSNSFATQ